MSKRTAQDRQAGGDNESYPTPSWAVERLCDRLALRGSCWLEPACGHGSIIATIRSRFTLDCAPIFDAVDPHQAPIVEGVGRYSATSFLKWAPYHRYPVAITNPPFSLAEQFARRMLEVADNVLLLLRLNWLGSAKRADFFEHHMPDRIFVLPDRPIFRRSPKTGKPQSDSCEYAWFYWGPERAGAGVVERLATTPAAQRKASREATWRMCGLMKMREEGT